MHEPPQVGGEDWDLGSYRRFVDTHVASLRDWYHKRAQRNRFAFRSAGILVILLSALLPLLAGFDFARKDWILGLIGVAIAVATGLRSFYQWDQLWALLRRTDFELTELLAEWELAVATAKDPAEVHELTEKLLQKAGNVRRSESTGYFATLRFPEGKGSR